MRLFYISSLFLFLSASLTQAQESERDAPPSLFPNLEQVLYQDAAHAYDDEQVIMLSRQRIPDLHSELIPVKKGDNFLVEVNAHYTKGSTTQILKRVGTTVAGTAIATLPTLLSPRQSGESSAFDETNKGAIVVGAAVALSPLIVDKLGQRRLQKQLSSPNIRNGLGVPDAYLQYNLYNQEGVLIKSEHRAISKKAKDAWQPLYLRQQVAEDGYLSVDLVNTSRRPVWLDGFKLSYASYKSVVANVRAAKRSLSTTGRLKNIGAKPPTPNAPIDSIYTNDSHPCSPGSAALDDCEEDPNAPGTPGGGGSGSYIVGGNGTASNPYLLAEGVVVTAKPINSSSSGTEDVGNGVYYYNGGTWNTGGTGGGGASVTSSAGHYRHVNGNPPSANPGGPPPSNPIPTDPGDDGVPNPGKKDWRGLNSNEKMAHIVKAIQYAKQEGIAVNLNDYFTYLPRTGNTGFGKQYRISGKIRINGVEVPLSIEIPVNSSERVFNSKPIDTQMIYDAGATYGPYTRYYYYGLGNRHINSAKIFFPEEYDDIMEDVIGY